MTCSKITSGRKTVTSAGTAEALGNPTNCQKIEITALATNTDAVVIGCPNVVAAEVARQGTPLYAGDTLTLNIDNLSKVFIDSVVNGEGVSFNIYS